MNDGDRTISLKVTPDRLVPHRYAGASEDFNPIHIDAEHARSVGLPGNILHGLYTMGLATRAVLDATGGDPRSLRSISVRFRAIAFPEREIEISGTVGEGDGEGARIALVAEQGDVTILDEGVALTTLAD